MEWMQKRFQILFTQNWSPLGLGTATLGISIVKVSLLLPMYVQRTRSKFTVHCMGIDILVTFEIQCPFSFKWRISVQGSRNRTSSSGGKMSSEYYETQYCWNWMWTVNWLSHLINGNTLCTFRWVCNDDLLSLLWQCTRSDDPCPHVLPGLAQTLNLAVTITSPPPPTVVQERHKHGRALSVFTVSYWEWVSHHFFTHRQYSLYYIASMQTIQIGTRTNYLETFQETHKMSSKFTRSYTKHNKSSHISTHSKTFWDVYSCTHDTASCK